MGGDSSFSQIVVTKTIGKDRKFIPNTLWIGMKIYQQKNDFKQQ